jgi:predicted nucleotidyltransferase
MICEAVDAVAKTFAVKQVSYFGSYADGRATDDSDLDVLIEFESKAVSLLTIVNIKYILEEMLGVPVDVIHAPIPETSLIKPTKVVQVYAA